MTVITATAPNQLSGLEEGRVVDATGRLLAHGTTTCMVFAALGGGR